MSVLMKNSFKQYVKGLFLFRGWHPEVALRYLPIVARIKKLDRKPSVLDVGSGGLGIAPYIKMKVTGLDVGFSPPYHERLLKIEASALKLPFADASFRIVVSVDMLEHLSKTERFQAISEMIRVAGKAVFLAVPSGKLSQAQDEQLSLYYREKFGKSYHFFDEQIGFGLPEPSDLSADIRKAARMQNKKIRVEIENNENLKLRDFLMKGWMTKNLFINVFFRKIMLLVLPLMIRLNRPPAYRKIFYVYIQK